MAIYEIPRDFDTNAITDWNLDESKISSFKTIDNYSDRIVELRKKSQYLQNLSIEDVLFFFDSLTVHWLTDPELKFLGKFSSLGITFLINFLKKTNLQKLLAESLNDNIHFLDGFGKVENLDKYLMVQPKGVITHWLAGNVPVLGMISLLQGTLSKNSNVIKLPRENGLVLPLMAKDIAEYECISQSGTIRGREILDSCIFVYCDREDKEGQETLSINSDVRVAWGGREAVENVMTLPRKYGTDDIIFGPKYSFAVVARDSFQADKLNDLAYKLALDASVFEQQGCNSPHTVFVERGGQISPIEFAEALAKSMDEVLKRIPKNQISADEAYTIVNIRSEYSFLGRVFSSKGTEWSVIYSDEQGLADACYSRIIFVRPVENIEEVLEFIQPKNHQTLGLCINENDKLEFAQKATARGIERVTEIGKMSIYDYPWDGMFPINHFVRWVSVY
jgi:hypothetical protein